MEAFSLLKYWRGGGGAGGGGVIIGSTDSSVNPRATTIVTAVADNSMETDDDDEESNDDDGPFFDLEFAVADEEEEENEEDEDGKKESNGVSTEEQNNIDDEEEDDEDDDTDSEGTEEEEREFNFSSSNDRVDQNLPLSPSDDLFFKGRLVPIEPPPPPSSSSSEPNSKSQFHASFLKSATKFRVFMLGFKKSKLDNKSSTTVAAQPAAKETTDSSNSGSNAPSVTSPKEEETTKLNSKKLFTVKFKVEEVPLVSLFTRENSKSNNKTQKEHQANNPDHSATVDEKRFSKDVMHKYLKKVKPLYIRVSKRYGEKLKFSGQLSVGSGLKLSALAPPPPPPPPTGEKSSSSSPPAKSTTTTTMVDKKQPDPEIVEAAAVLSNVKSLKQAGLRVVCKHLGKSRSASSAVEAATAAAGAAPVVSRRRDDSLLQQQDGIQSAILHCKRSFNASRDSDSSLLSRSVSDPSHEKSLELSRKSSSDEGKV